MRLLKKIIPFALSMIITLSFTISLAANVQPQTQNAASLLEKALKNEIAKILNINNPISYEMTVTSAGQKPIAFGINTVVNKTSFYKVAIDKTNKRYYIESKKNNVASEAFVNGQKIYIKTPKDKSYIENTINPNMWLLMNMMDVKLTPNANKLTQTISNYIMSQTSSILKSVYKTKTTIAGKNIDCYSVSIVLPSKVLEPALKEFLISSANGLNPILSSTIKTYVSTLTDQEKQALKSLNIDTLDSNQISKQIGDNINAFVNSLKLDDMNATFYLDAKTNKIVKIIVKNVPSSSAGISSRVEINNILTGNEVKFPQINQNTTSKFAVKDKLLNILKLIEGFIVKIGE